MIRRRKSTTTTVPGSFQVSLVVYWKVVSCCTCSGSSFVLYIEIAKKAQVQAHSFFLRITTMDACFVVCMFVAKENLQALYQNRNIMSQEQTISSYISHFT